MRSIEYIKTQRDMTPDGFMMEAPVYLVSEAMLRELGNSSGKVRFLLPGAYAKGGEVEVKVAASVFSDIDEYIAYNKSWSKNEIIMISLEETYLKKSTIHSKHTDQTQLIKVLPGEQMKYIRIFDKNYSVVSYIT